MKSVCWLTLLIFVVLTTVHSTVSFTNADGDAKKKENEDRDKINTNEKYGRENGVTDQDTDVVKRSKFVVVKDDEDDEEEADEYAYGRSFIGQADREGNQGDDSSVPNHKKEKDEFTREKRRYKRRFRGGFGGRFGGGRFGGRGGRFPSFRVPAPSPAFRRPAARPAVLSHSPRVSHSPQVNSNSPAARVHPSPGQHDLQGGMKQNDGHVQGNNPNSVPNGNPRPQPPNYNSNPNPYNNHPPPYNPSANGPPNSGGGAQQSPNAGGNRPGGAMPIPIPIPIPLPIGGHQRPHSQNNHQNKTHCNNCTKNASPSITHRKRDVIENLLFTLVISTVFIVVYIVP